MTLGLWSCEQPQLRTSQVVASGPVVGTLVVLVLVVLVVLVVVLVEFPEVEPLPPSVS
jgi:hypothetical protein